MRLLCLATGHLIPYSDYNMEWTIEDPWFDFIAEEIYLCSVQTIL